MLSCRYPARRGCQQRPGVSGCSEGRTYSTRAGGHCVTGCIVTGSIISCSVRSRMGGGTPKSKSTVVIQSALGFPRAPPSVHAQHRIRPSGSIHMSLVTVPCGREPGRTDRVARRQSAVLLPRASPGPLDRSSRPITIVTAYRVVRASPMVSSSPASSQVMEPDPSRSRNRSAAGSRGSVVAGAELNCVQPPGSPPAVAVPSQKK